MSPDPLSRRWGLGTRLMNKLLNTVDREIFTVKNFSPLGHEGKIKRTNISYTKKSYAKISQSTVAEYSGSEAMPHDVHLVYTAVHYTETTVVTEQRGSIDAT